MKKNRLFAFALVLVLAASAMLAGCAASGKPAESTEAAGDQLARIQAKGEIIVAMEGTWAPWTYHDESDQLVGYDVEVAKAVAEKLGVTASFVEGEWDGLLAGQDAGAHSPAAEARRDPRPAGRIDHGPGLYLIEQRAKLGRPVQIERAVDQVAEMGRGHGALMAAGVSLRGAWGRGRRAGRRRRG